MKKSNRYLLLICLLFTAKSIKAQNNLSPGDFAFVSYQSDFDPTNTFTTGLAEFEDRFSIVVLKSGGLAAGTVIYFTDRGWNGVTNNWLGEIYPPFSFGQGNEAVFKWTVPAGGIPQGKEVFFIDIYHDELPSGTEYYYEWIARSNENGTVPLGTITNETPIVPSTAAGVTDGVNLPVSGDNILAYQTGPTAGPTGGYNSTTIRFITAILANIRPTNVGTPTSYLSWDPAPVVLDESSVPPGLVNGQTCFLMSPGPLPAATAPNGTIEPDNGKFSANALSSAGTCTPLQMCAIIYNITNWTYSASVFPLGTSSSFCTYNILQPVSYSSQPSAVTACAGLPASFNVAASGGGTLTYQWQQSNDAAFTAPTTLSNTGVFGGTATNILTISDNTGLGGKYYRSIVTGPCGAVNSNGALLTVTNPTLSANNTVTQAVGTQNNLYYAASCAVIDKVVPSGASPVTGNLSSQVWVEAGVIVIGSSALVQRHYQVTPAVNPGSATGTVTLYFSQAEFDAFNSNPNSPLNLPTGAADAAGKANLRIAKYNGSSVGGTGLPATYNSGASIIDPVDANIVFNSTFSRWEITFDVTGFSGFFVQTNATVIPVKLTSFTAQHINDDIRLQWQTASEINNHHFEVERSSDGIHFTVLGSVPAGNGNLVNDYSFTDAMAARMNAARLYYRLKSVSLSGEAEYSRVIVIPLKNSAGIITGVTPNPFGDQLTINLNLPAKTLLDIKISDMAGRELGSKKITVAAGYSAVQLNDLEGLSKGIYLLSVYTEGNLSTFKLVK